MIRWIRRLTLIGAGIALYLGADCLPWATWNNLNDGKFRNHVNETGLHLLWARGESSDTIAALRPLKDKQFPDYNSFEKAIQAALPGGEYQHEKFWEAFRDRTKGFSSREKAKDQPVCFVNAFRTRGDYVYELFVFRNRADGTLLGIAGDPEMGPIQEEGIAVARKQAEYEFVEDVTIASPSFGGGGKTIRQGTSDVAFPTFLMIVLAIFLLVAAAFLRRKLVVAILVLPALVYGIYPLAALWNFVADASKLKLSGIELDPAIGAGSYVMLAGGLLAALGGILVWFEPARAPAQAAEKKAS